MFSLAVCSVFISSVFGGPVLYGGSIPVHVPVGVVATAPAAVVPLPLLHTLRSQFHSQDELGQYSYGYSNEHSSKVETKDFTGLTSGGYSYIDANGLVQNINYIADDVNGFRVAASNLPVAPVAQEPAAPVAPVFPLPGLPEPVSDTPEVQKAKEEHEKAKAEAEKAAAASAESSEESSTDQDNSSSSSSSSVESTEDNAESETKPEGSEQESDRPATSPAAPTTPTSAATPATATGAPQDGSDEGNQSIDAPSGAQNPEAPVVAPQVTIDSAPIHSYVGTPLFRAGPPYLTYLPGAYVALNNQETPVVPYASSLPYPIGKFYSVAGPLNKRLGAPSKFPFALDRVNVDTNAVSKR